MKKAWCHWIYYCNFPRILESNMSCAYGLWDFNLFHLALLMLGNDVDSHKLSTVYILTKCSTYILNDGQKLMNILENFCMDSRWVLIAPQQNLCSWRLKARINHTLYTIMTLHLEERKTHYYVFENICNGEEIKYWVSRNISSIHTLVFL